MTRKELFDIQQAIASAAFNINNWINILADDLPDDFVIGEIHPVTKSEILDSMRVSIRKLSHKSQEMRRWLDATKSNLNDITSFFYYMWNAWNEKECMTVFQETGTGEHVWSKWCQYAKTEQGAAECLYGVLDTQHRDLLVKRALELYDGKDLKQQ